MFPTVLLKRRFGTRLESRFTARFGSLRRWVVGVRLGTMALIFLASRSGFANANGFEGHLHVTESPLAESVESGTELSLARKEVEFGAVAFSGEDYATALEHFERALTLRESAKLHYNVAVCHHQLLFGATSELDVQRHTDRAIRAYNAYLSMEPEAVDRGDVEGMIDDLGGTVRKPTIRANVFASLSKAAAPSALAPSEVMVAASPRSSTTASPTKSSSKGVRQDAGRKREVTLLAGVGAVPQLIGSSVVEGGATFLLDARVGGRLGEHFAIGGGLGVYSATNQTPHRLSFSGGHLYVWTDYRWQPGGRASRVELRAGALTGASHQAIRTRSGSIVPTCREVGSDVSVVGSRSGLLLGGRAALAVLLGRNRAHEVGLQLLPSFGIYGRGTQGESCEENQTPVTSLRLNRRVTGAYWIGAAYSIKF